MSKKIKDFISSIDNSLYNKIRQSKSDAECRRYLREHLEAINYTHCCTDLCDKCNKENHLQKLTDQAQDLGLGYD